MVSSSGYVYPSTQFSPVLGNISGNFLAGQTFVSSVLDIVGSSTLTYSLGSITVGATTGVTFTFSPPANVGGIIKTPVLYDSAENSASTVSVVYYVSDSFGTFSMLFDYLMIRALIYVSI